MQINPPYDGSAPCPMCPEEVRGISALVHNFLVRWPQGKAFVKLNDLRNFHKPSEVKAGHPAVVELLTVAQLLVEAVADMKDEGLQIIWTPEIFQRVKAIEPRARAASAAINPLSEEHFRDERHYSGRDNLLVQRQGGGVTVDGKSYDYSYPVEVVVQDADLVHTPCGTGLKIHQHFKDELARDPKFYGRVFCPTCSLNAPFAQWENRIV